MKISLLILNLTALFGQAWVHFTELVSQSLFPLLCFGFFGLVFGLVCRSIILVLVLKTNWKGTEVNYNCCKWSWDKHWSTHTKLNKWNIGLFSAKIILHISSLILVKGLCGYKSDWFSNSILVQFGLGTQTNFCPAAVYLNHSKGGIFIFSFHAIGRKWRPHSLHLGFQCPELVLSEISGSVIPPRLRSPIPTESSATLHILYLHLLLLLILPLLPLFR